jgi:hypothetical protein
VARTVDITADEVIVRLTGWTALAALRRELPLVVVGVDDPFAVAASCAVGAQTGGSRGE